MDTHPEIDPADALKLRVEELFLAVCADPDDTESATAAAQALRELDQLLAVR